MKTCCFTTVLLSCLLMTAFAVEILQVPSPDNANSLMIDKSGRHDVIQLRAGVKVIRLFYDDIDALKPYLAKAFGVQVAKVGKISAPIYKSAKWLSSTELQVVCDSGVAIADAEREFDFTAIVDTTGKLVNATIVKAAATPKPTPKAKPQPTKGQPTKGKLKRSD